MSDPVFIIGSPRSGTTVLAWALAQHPQLWTGGEFHLFSRLFGDRRLETLLANELEFPGVLRRANVTAERFLEDVGSGFDALFWRISGGRRWVDQTPANTYLADTLAAMFPTAQFVHLLRDGRQVVDSMTHFADSHTQERRSELTRLGYFPPWALTFDAACHEWAQSVDTAERFVKLHPNRSMTAHYAQLVQDPDAFFGEILKFLGCEISNKPALFVRTHRLNSSFGDDTRSDSARRQAAEWTAVEKRSYEAAASGTELRMRSGDEKPVKSAST